MNYSKLILLLSVLLIALASSAFVRADDLDQNLIAKWSFKDGSLVSDSGEYTLKAGGRGTMEAKNGSVTLKDFKYLISTDITSARFPALMTSATIWARLRFEELPTEGVANVMSLQSTPGGGSWSAITFALLYGANGFGYMLKASDETELGIGPTRSVPVQAGETVNLAIVFDGERHTGTLWINGKVISSTRRQTVSLQDFAAFAFGQLMFPGAKCTVTFEEVRIYSTALDAQWLAEIVPTPK